MRATRTALMVFVGLTSLLAPGSLALAAGDLTAEQLIELAPVIKSSDAKRKSIEIEGFIRLNKEARMNIRVLFRASGQSSLVVTDSADGTPFVFSASNKTVVYDPIESVVIYYANSIDLFSFGASEDKVRWSCFSGKSDEKDEKSDINLDLKSLLAMPYKTRSAIKTGDKTYRLALTSERGSTLIANVDLDRSCPFTRIEMREKGMDEPAFCLEKIILDGDLGDKDFAFPSKARLAETLPLVDYSNDTLLNNAASWALISRATYGRLAILDPQWRAALDPGNVAKVDWDKVRENDRKYSKALRELIKMSDKAPKPAPPRKPDASVRKPGNTPGKTR
jgi:hypothetical protein